MRFLEEKQAMWEQQVDVGALWQGILSRVTMQQGDMYAYDKAQ